MPRTSHIILQLNHCSSDSSISSCMEEHFALKTTETLVQRPFCESFFRALPLVVHPVIVLRLLCHKMFGNMLRRKTARAPSPDRNSLTPPPVLESELCPVWSGVPDSDAGSCDGKPVAGFNRVSQSAFRRRIDMLKRSNVHVLITAPGRPCQEDNEEEFQLQRRRTRRAGSMDKHLLRVGSAKRRSINAAMSIAMRTIGNSLMQPLELSVSPPAMSGESGLPDGKRRTFFRFPSLRKRSKSQGYIARLEDSTDSVLCTNLSSTLSICKPADSEIKDFQKELINLPIFEVDMRGTDYRDSTSVSRFSSVPEQLEYLHVKNILEVESGGRPAAACNTSSPPPPSRHGALKLQTSVQASSDGTCIFAGSLPSKGSRQKKVPVIGEQAFSGIKDSKNVSLPAVDGHNIANNDTINHQSHISSIPFSPSLPSDAIVFHFAAATPCESPVATADQMALMFSDDSRNSSSSFDNVCLKLLQIGVSSPKTGASTPTSECGYGGAPADINSLVPRPSTLWSPEKRTDQYSTLSLHSNLSLSPQAFCSSGSSELRSPNFSLILPSPGPEVPIQHRSVMELVETWVSICSLDLDCCLLMRKEAKDFLTKMSSLGVEYKTWSHRLQEKLRLEVWYLNCI